jgi:hypothetical protein
MPWRPQKRALKISKRQTSRQASRKTGPALSFVKAPHSAAVIEWFSAAATICPNALAGSARLACRARASTKSSV